ncbi:MAG: MFS transporter [Victivallales bacterium]|nr:MFS transporter [Victivallales bacterium]
MNAWKKYSGRRLSRYRNSFRTTTRALRSRNFRLFLSGQCISLVGTWMQRIALSWLVYRLSGSVLLLGTIAFVGQLPISLLAPFAGVLIDRVNRHRLIIVTQIVAMIQALILAVLVLGNWIQIWQILVLSVVLGIVNAVDMPGRQAFMYEMIDDRADLGNAIALNSSVFNVARLLGPSIAGILIAVLGEGLCFLINAVSYIAVVAALFMMRLRPHELPKGEHHPFRELREGVVYAYSFPPIRTILLLLMLLSLMIMPHTVLMPVFAKNILHGGSQTLGMLMAAAGVGALTAAVYLASRPTILGLTGKIVRSGLVMSVGMIILALSRSLLLALLDMTLIGFGLVFMMAAGNTMLQTMVDDDKRGRVMSLYSLSLAGMGPFGSLLFGALAHWLGVPWTLAIGGIAGLIGIAAFYCYLPEMRRHIRPLYIKLGLIAGPKSS